MQEKKTHRPTWYFNIKGKPFKTTDKTKAETLRGQGTEISRKAYKALRYVKKNGTVP